MGSEMCIRDRDIVPSLLLNGDSDVTPQLISLRLADKIHESPEKYEMRDI